MLREVFCEISKEIETHLDDPNYHVQSKIKFVLYFYSQIANVLQTNYNLIQLTHLTMVKKKSTIDKIMILTKLEPEYMHYIIK